MTGIARKAKFLWGYRFDATHIEVATRGAVTRDLVHKWTQLGHLGGILEPTEGRPRQFSFEQVLAIALMAEIRKNGFDVSTASIWAGHFLAVLQRDQRRPEMAAFSRDFREPKFIYEQDDLVQLHIDAWQHRGLWRSVETVNIKEIQSDAAEHLLGMVWRPELEDDQPAPTADEIIRDDSLNTKPLGHILIGGPIGKIKLDPKGEGE